MATMTEAQQERYTASRRSGLPKAKMKKVRVWGGADGHVARLSAPPALTARPPRPTSTFPVPWVPPWPRSCCSTCWAPT